VAYIGYWRIVSYLLLLGLFVACNRCMEPCVHGICKKKTCHCDLWWEGDGCERSQLKRFEGHYTGNAPCGDSVNTVKYTLTVDEGIPNRLWLNNDELYFDFTTSVRFDIPAQEWRGHTVEGEGQMLVEEVSFHYVYTDTIPAAPCLIEAQLQDN